MAAAPPSGTRVTNGLVESAEYVQSSRAAPPLDGCGVRLACFESVKTLGFALCRVCWPCQLLCQGIRAALAGCVPAWRHISHRACWLTSSISTQPSFHPEVTHPSRSHQPALPCFSSRHPGQKEFSLVLEGGEPFVARRGLGSGFG